MKNIEQTRRHRVYPSHGDKIPSREQKHHECTSKPKKAQDYYTLCLKVTPYSINVQESIIKIGDLQLPLQV